MKRIIITGFSGFVSRHFLKYLYDNKLEYEVLGIDVQSPPQRLENYEDVLKVRFINMNLLDKEALDEVIREFQPEYILHLASFSSVAYSWRCPADSFSNNTRIFLNIVECLKENNLNDCRVLSVGSSEEYGNVQEEQLPLEETLHLEPVSPYAVARVAQEMMAKVYVQGYDMKIVLTRSFNHIGPYQDERFVVPSFVRRILNVKDTGNKSGVIETGDISIVRDFLDVRDVVRAYYMLLTEGIPGEIYNICSGKGVSLQDVMREIADILDVDIKNEINLEFVRPDDNRKIIGSYDKIKNELGWTPTISLRKTLEDMICSMKNNK